MAEFPAGQEQKLKQLISSYRCHVCRRCFEREHVRVAARHEQLWIVSVRCSLCRNQQVFWIALKDDKEESLPAGRISSEKTKNSPRWRRSTRMTCSTCTNF